MMRALLVFALMATVDALWARYIAAVAARHPVRAAGYSAGIVLAGAVTTLSYVESHWMVVPAALGAFVGTFLSLRRKP